MCFKFLRNGARGCNKLDYTYAHPKMCRISLITGRGARINCFYYHKTGTIRPVLSKSTQGPTKPTIPIMELNIVLVPTTPACTWWNRPEEDLSSGKSESTHPSRIVVKSIKFFLWSRVSCMRQC